MNTLPFMSTRTPIIEVGFRHLFLLDGADGLETQLERDDSLRLTQACIAHVAAQLGEWAKSHGWERGRPVWCAIGGRGVSLRRLSLPVTAVDKLEAVLSLQIESEFPVPPSELAWGFMQLPPDNSRSSANVLVGAIKPEALQDLQALCQAAGIQPIFTIASLARSSLCPSNGPDSFALVHVEGQQSELICFQDGIPETIRIIRWGSDNADVSLQSTLQVSLASALQEFRSTSTLPGRREDLRRELLKAFEPLREGLPTGARDQVLYCSGDRPSLEGIELLLAPTQGGSRRVESLTSVSGPGRTPATQGIHDWETRFPGRPLLQLQSRGSHLPLPTRRASPLKWGLVAVLLLFALLSLRYVEPLLGKARLARRLEEVEKQKALLPKLEQELGFLQYLQRNQPPFLEAVATLAQSASPGLRIDSLSMNRKGEVSLRGTFANGPQAVDLRLKLIESGFFSTVVVEEQSPTPDRNQVIVRMSAQWKSPEDRLAASLKVAAAKSPAAEVSTSAARANPAPPATPKPTSAAANKP